MAKNKVCYQTVAAEHHDYMTANQEALKTALKLKGFVGVVGTSLCVKHRDKYGNVMCYLATVTAEVHG